MVYYEVVALIVGIVLVVVPPCIFGWYSLAY